MFGTARKSQSGRSSPHARAAGEFQYFERRLNDYLAPMAHSAPQTPELAADIGALRFAAMTLRREKKVLVDLIGLGVDGYSSCEYADGEFS